MPEHEPPPRSDLLPGTLDMLVLRTLTLGSLHGYGIAQHLSQSTDGVIGVEAGSLYPALERLLRKGWVTARWGPSPTGRRARFYTITRSGLVRLEERVADYERFVGAVSRILSGA
jgi:PadR family transcriptional regulator, regulatory protein PadR